MSDTITFIHKNIKNIRSNKNILIALCVIFVIIIYCIILLTKQIIKNRSNTSIYFKYPIKADKYKQIASKNIPESKNDFQFTYTSWIYINDWSYKYNKYKHIFTKGTSYYSPNTMCPAVYLDPSVNNIIIFLSTEKGLTKSVIKNVPIHKWVFITIVIKASSIDSYMNAKLISSKTLNGNPIINYGDIHVNYMGGFGGNISSLTYTPYALNMEQIISIYKRGYNTDDVLSSIFRKMINFLFPNKYNKKNYKLQNNNPNNKEAFIKFKGLGSCKASTVVKLNSESGMLITDCKELCGESNECYGINFKGLGVGGLGNCTLLKNLNHTKKPRVKVTYKPKSLCYIKELDFTDNMINKNKEKELNTIKYNKMKDIYNKIKKGNTSKRCKSNKI